MHYCVFCGHSRGAATTTMLEPSCPSCGCPLRSCDEAEFPRIAESLKDKREPRTPRFDGAGPIAALTAGPMLLPIIGVEVRDVIFAVPLIFLIFAAVLAKGAAARDGEPRGAWSAIALASALAAACVALGILLQIAGASTDVAHRLGTAASVALTGGLALFLWPRMRFVRAYRVLDVAQLIVLVLAAGIYFLVVPGFAGGDTLLTVTVVCDLAAFALAGLLAAASRRRQDVRVAKRLWGMAFFVLVADAVAARHAIGGFAHSEELSAALYAIGAWFLASASVSERPKARPEDVRDPDTQTEWRWFTARVLVPTVQVAAFPAVLALAIASDGASTWPIAWFGGAFLLVVLAAFARQAYLVIDHRRAVIDERKHRRQAQRRNEELEALTGLATTMTQTLEEAPIVEQALTVLHTAARATSSALHVSDDGKRKLRASAGRWQAEHPWADRLGDVESEGDVTRTIRGGRQVTRIALGARGHDIGWVTLVRPATDPLGDRELDLLRLLVDQMAIAVQNARDYREKLEQAIRDPLTGIYNRRYFFEALEKEVQRSRRYGSHAALVLIDVDNFKRINDTRGHAVGDDVLRGIANVVEPLLRPVDSFARIGGEEFALLLPETQQLDALLVAERVRSTISRHEMVPGLRVTVSAGVGACPQDAPTREDLVKRTDAAMYWAKRNGKDMCAVVNEATDGLAEESATERDAAAANLSSLVTAIDADTLKTRDHSDTVAGYAVALGKAAGLDRDRLVMLRRAAALHDVGKVAVRPEILDKTGRLTGAELAEIRLHSTVGASMLHHAGLTDEAAWVRHHHERIDGAGYPDGLAGTAIPLESRILFIADAFEAMTSDRPYRAARSVEEALEELRRCAGTQFEPHLVELLCELVASGELDVTALRAA